MHECRRYAHMANAVFKICSSPKRASWGNIPQALRERCTRVSNIVIVQAHIL
jgi:hypothetical protein